MTRRAPTTPATAALDALGVRYSAHPYEFEPADGGYGAAAARALGVPPERVCKTLVVDADGALVIVVVPVSSALDLRALAAARGAKRAVMADPDLAERRTGYVVGGISPLGQRTRMPLVLDASATGFPTIFVSGGRRGFDVELAPSDLLRATGGVVAAVAVPR